MTEWQLRQSPRYPVNLEVKEVNDCPEPETYLQDISAFGTLLETPVLMVPDDEIKLRINLPETGEELILRGVVVWIRSAFYTENRYLIGIKFPQPNWQGEEVGEKFFFG